MVPAKSARPARPLLDQIESWPLRGWDGHGGSLRAWWHVAVGLYVFQFKGALFDSLTFPVGQSPYLGNVFFLVPQANPRLDIYIYNNDNIMCSLGAKP